MFTDLVSMAAEQFGFPAEEQQIQQPVYDGLTGFGQQALGNAGVVDLMSLFNTQNTPAYCSNFNQGYSETVPLNAPEQYRGIIQEAAKYYNIDPVYLQELIRAESDFNPNSHSHAGAMGLTQMMPDTAKEMGITNPWDPKQSIYGGARYLSNMLHRYNGNYSLALAAYNAGPGRVDKVMRVPNIKETQDYVAKISRRVAAIKAQRVVNDWGL